MPEQTDTPPSSPPMGRAALEAILAEHVNFRDHEIGDAPAAILAAGWISPEEAAAFRACVAELQHCDDVSRSLLEKERARVAELEAQLERRRARLVVQSDDLLEVRGLLSPQGGLRRVPDEISLAESIVPAVEWLVGRVAELENQVGVLEGLVAE